MERDGSKFLFGLIAGIIVGGLTGLLLAPQPGEETRKKLTDAAEKLKDTINEVTEKFKKGALDFSEKIKNESTEEDEA